MQGGARPRRGEVGRDPGHERDPWQGTPTPVLAPCFWAFHFFHPFWPDLCMFVVRGCEWVQTSHWNLSCTVKFKSAPVPLLLASAVIFDLAGDKKILACKVVNCLKFTCLFWWINRIFCLWYVLSRGEYLADELRHWSVSTISHTCQKKERKKNEKKEKRDILRQKPPGLEKYFLTTLPQPHTRESNPVKIPPKSFYPHKSILLYIPLMNSSPTNYTTCISIRFGFFTMWLFYFYRRLFVHWWH